LSEVGFSRQPHGQHSVLLRRAGPRERGDLFVHQVQVKRLRDALGIAVGALLQQRSRYLQTDTTTHKSDLLLVRTSVGMRLTTGTPAAIASRTGRCMPTGKESSTATAWDRTRWKLLSSIGGKKRRRLHDTTHTIVKLSAKLLRQQGTYLPNGIA
jgi:hypothetical protein